MHESQRRVRMKSFAERYVVGQKKVLRIAGTDDVFRIPVLQCQMYAQYPLIRHTPN